MADWIIEANDMDSITEGNFAFVGTLIHCQECKHYHKNVWGGDIRIGRPYDNIIVGHHGCDRWGKGDGKGMAYTSPNGFCFLGERKE